MLLVVFQCIKNVLAQFDTVDSNTVSRHINNTTVKQDVAFSPGNATNRCLFVVFMMPQTTPPMPNMILIFDLYVRIYPIFNNLKLFIFFYCYVIHLHTLSFELSIQTLKLCFYVCFFNFYKAG